MDFSLEHASWFAPPIERAVVGTSVRLPLQFSVLG